ncbi:MAG: hypothetical protein FJ308_13325 [Planctomycetes bacterium]|nr:hypothetical protein [Planctomycetota bacterium]
MSIFDFLRRKSKKVDYRLDSNPQAFYSSQFSPNSVFFVPFRAQGSYQLVDNGWVPASDEVNLPVHCLNEQREQAAIKINGPMEFSISVPCTGRNITPKQISDMKFVLDNIVAMDCESRRQISEPETVYDECLAYVEIENSEVHLHYFANTMNTEWGAYFLLGTDGDWKFQTLG